jgi:hypothetical protein
MVDAVLTAGEKGKKEGMPPSGPQACMRVGKRVLCFGLKPFVKTQRFLPEFRNSPSPPHFSCGRCSRVRALGAAQGLGLGGGRYASKGARVVMPPGLAPGSRDGKACQSPALAGAANGSSNFVTVSTLSLLSGTDVGHIAYIGIISIDVGK